MTQKATTAKAKTTATAKAPATKPRKVLTTSQKIVDAKTTRAPIPKVPRQEEVNDADWMNWVEYAQAKIKYLENKLAGALITIEEQKANIDRLNRRILQG